MTISDWIMIAAVFSGPLVAVQLTRYLDNKKEVRNRKLEIFKILMTTRSYPLSYDHVYALNRIDLEFDKNIEKEKEVIILWKAYLDSLSDSQHTYVMRRDKFIELLHSMALVLDYDFDKTHIKNSSYSPAAHGNTEEQQTLLRQHLIDLLEGKRSLPMEVTKLPSQD